MTRDSDDIFEGFGPPPAPTNLRQRVLEAANAEAMQPTARRLATRLVDRLWESRPLWLAWSTVVAILLTTHLLLARAVLSPSNSPNSAFGPTTSSSRLVADDTDLLRVLNRHPHQRTSVLARNLRITLVPSISPPTPPSTSPEGGSA